MLGFAKSFVVMIILAVTLGIVTKNIWNTLIILLFYVIIKISWKFLTQ